MLANRVREFTTTVGTGNITLGGAFAGHVRFADAFAVADSVIYVVEDGDNYEIGTGTLADENTLVRSAVSETLVDGTLDKDAPAAIDLSGEARIYCAVSADYLLNPSKEADVINEVTPDTGVTVDGVLLKDGGGGFPAGITANTGVFTSVVENGAVLSSKYLGIIDTAAAAEKLSVARAITISGDAIGTSSFDGANDVNIALSVADNSHNHTLENVTGLHAALNDKFDKTGGSIAGDVVVTGQLTVAGDLLTQSSNDVNIGDSIVTLNAELAASSAPSLDAGFEVNRGNETPAYALFREGTDEWNLSHSLHVEGGAKVAGNINAVDATFTGFVSFDDGLSVKRNGSHITLYDTNNVNNVNSRGYIEYDNDITKFGMWDADTNEWKNFFEVNKGKALVNTPEPRYHLRGTELSGVHYNAVEFFNQPGTNMFSLHQSYIGGETHVVYDSRSTGDHVFKYRGVETFRTGDNGSSIKDKLTIGIEASAETRNLLTLLSDAPRIRLGTGAGHPNWKLAVQDTVNRGFTISASTSDDPNPLDDIYSDVFTLLDTGDTSVSGTLSAKGSAFLNTGGAAGVMLSLVGDNSYTHTISNVGIGNELQFKVNSSGATVDFQSSEGSYFSANPLRATFSGDINLSTGVLKYGGSTLVTRDGDTNFRDVVGSGKLTVDGGSKISVQNQNNGGSGHGIFLWDTDNTTWGIYMSQAGAGFSLGDGAACTSLNGDGAFHVRHRVPNTNGYGWIWENASEQCLMSLTADAGDLYTRGNIKSGGDITVGGTAIHRDTAAGALIASGGSEENLGANIRLNGENIADPNNIFFRTGSVNRLTWDDTGREWNFQGNMMTGVGNTRMSGTQIYRTDEVSQLFVSGGATVSSGSNIVLHGSGASNANDILLRTGSNTRLHWNDSSLAWDFKNNTITAAGKVGIGGAYAVGNHLLKLTSSFGDMIQFDRTSNPNVDNNFYVTVSNADGTSATDFIALGPNVNSLRVYGDGDVEVVNNLKVGNRITTTGKVTAGDIEVTGTLSSQFGTVRPDPGTLQPGARFYDTVLDKPVYVNAAQDDWVDGGGASGDGSAPGVVSGNMLTVGDNTDAAVVMRGRSDRTGNNQTLYAMHGLWNGQRVAQIEIQSGHDNSAKDDGEIAFYTQENSGSGAVEVLRLHNDQSASFAGDVTIRNSQGFKVGG
ncbi:MAG: hypothetical protein AB3N28_15560, partial [Kordiimonas sp.]